MQKSIKKILSFVMIFTIIITTLSVVAFADTLPTPVKELTVTPAISTATYDKTTGITTSKEGSATVAEAVRMLVYPSKDADGTAVDYTFDSYLTISMDIEIVERVATTEYYSGVPALFQFMDSSNKSIDVGEKIGLSFGSTGDKFTLSIIVTPERKVYIYYAGKLIQGNFADTITGFRYFRYLEKTPTTEGTYNKFKFGTATVKNYDSTCAIDDVLSAHAATTKDTVAWLPEGGRAIDKGNNTFTNNDNGVLRIQNTFGKDLKIGTDSFLAETSIKVNKRNETNWRNESAGIGVTIMIYGLKPDGTKYTCYANPAIGILQENKEYPFTMILGRDKKIYVSLGDAYVEYDLSGADTISSIVYYEGNAVDSTKPNELVLNPVNYTFFAGSEGINDISTLASVSATAQPMYSGYELADGEFDLTNIKDKNDGQNNLTEGTAYALIAAKFGTLLSEGADNVEYGMLISDEELTEELTVENSFKAEGVRNANGSFGILLYGNRLVPGNTIYARPYLKYLNKYYYGDGQSIVIPQPSQAE